MISDVASIVEGERKLFHLRLKARNLKKEQLEHHTHELRIQISGLQQQIDAKAEQLELIQGELKGVTQLWEKNLVPITRVNSLKRDAAGLEGEHGQLIASKAEAGGQIDAIELQIIQVDDVARKEAAEELSDVRAKIAELSERKIAAEDVLKHVDIRAPQTGRVHELSVHTVGGVIHAGETIMLIVPEDDTLSIEAKVSPQDIDELRPGQMTLLRFSSFDSRTTPEVNGAVSWIAPDKTEDPHTGASFFTVRVAVSKAELSRLGEP